MQPWLAVLYCQWGGAAVEMASFTAVVVAMAVQNDKLCRDHSGQPPIANSHAGPCPRAQEMRRRNAVQIKTLRKIKRALKVRKAKTPHTSILLPDPVHCVGSDARMHT